ncbi:carboxymuconolactone decarboxylase [Butyrivibrio sp. WCE2006]
MSFWINWHDFRKRKILSVLEIEGEDTSNEWCESVTDEDYLKIQ